MTEPSRPDDSRAARPVAERARCPRCGATLGRLAADPSDGAQDLYCGCCGLVLPGGSAVRTRAPR